MLRTRRQPDPHIKSTVKIPTGCSCQEAPRHFMFIIGSVLSYSLNISVLSSFLEARGLFMLYSYWDKLTVMREWQSSSYPYPSPPIPYPCPQREQMANSGLDGVVFYSLGSFFNPLQFATLAAEKQTQLSRYRTFVPLGLHQLHHHSPPGDEAEAAVMILKLLCGLGQSTWPA